MHIRASEWGLSLYEGTRPRFAGFGLGLGPDTEDGLIASASRKYADDLADYAEELGGEVERWWRFKAASGAPKGRWHVMRYLDGPGITGENLTTPTGRLKTYSDYESANRAAEQANIGITAERHLATSA